MTAGVDSQDLPRSEPSNDIQRPPAERFFDREGHLVKKNTELALLLEKTFAGTCLGGIGLFESAVRMLSELQCDPKTQCVEINCSSRPQSR